MLGHIAFVNADESPSIMNTILRILSVNYGSVYELPLHLKTGDGDLPPNTELTLLSRCACYSNSINCTAVVRIIVVYGGTAIRFNQKYLNLCSEDERRS